MATPVLMPRQGQSVESCILVAWRVAPGDRVEEGQVLAEIETDKATFEIESPATGTLVDRFFDEGEDVPVLTNIAAIGEPGEDISALRPGQGEEPPSADAEAPEKTTSPAAPIPVQSSISAGPAAGISPRAKRLAGAHGVVAATLAGSGPGGRVIERDVQAAIADGPRLSGLARESVLAGGLAAPATGSGPGGMVLAGDLQPASSPGPGDGFRDEPLSNIRKIIAARMHESLATTAQLTLNRSFDVSALQSLRGRIKAKGESLGLPNITLNDMIMYAVAQVLTRHPDLNAHFLGDRIRYFDVVHVGMAVDTPRGLMVPVVGNAHALDLAGMSRATRPLIESAQSGSISPDLLQGGTFTLTNLGMMGIESFTPVLNTPEVGILGICGIVPKPVMNADGMVKHVPSINLSLTVNHQVVDGSPAARFLQDLVETLEQFDPALAHPQLGDLNDL